MLSNSLQPFAVRRASRPTGSAGSAIDPRTLALKLAEYRRLLEAGSDWSGEASAGLGAWDADALLERAPAALVRFRPEKSLRDWLLGCAAEQPEHEWQILRGMTGSDYVSRQQVEPAVQALFQGLGISLEPGYLKYRYEVDEACDQIKTVFALNLGTGFEPIAPDDFEAHHVRVIGEVTRCSGQVHVRFDLVSVEYGSGMDTGRAEGDNTDDSLRAALRKAFAMLHLTITHAGHIAPDAPAGLSWSARRAA